MMSPDYEERAKNYGFAEQLDVLAALGRADTTLLDVRTEEEIAETGKIKGAGIWRRTTCSASACPQLAADPTQIVGNKESPVVIYCRSGRRARAAEDTLKKNGYSTVYNAGGYDDVIAMLKWQQKDNNQAARS